MVGDRIRLVGPLMWGGSRPGELDPSSPPVGSMGTVDWVNTWTNPLTEQFSVVWDGDVHGPPMLVSEDPYQLIPKLLGDDGKDDE